MSKKIVLTYVPQFEEGPARQFECRITDALGNGRLVGVAVREIRPLRKWYHTRTKYLGYKTFWLNDVISIAAGVNLVVNKLLEKEGDRLEMAQKWEEFEENY